MTSIEVETLTAVKKYCSKKANIDWEERRFDLVKIFLPIVASKVSNDIREDEIIEIAISAADNTIRHLQKQITNN